MSTAIQWTDETDNIFRVKGGGWWCRMISPGCAHCYAAKLNQSSFFGGNKLAYSGDAPEMVLQRDIINGWERQRKPKKHFVASMTDIFGDWVTEAMAIEFLRGMWRAPKQTFQMLTKRPDIARDRINHWLKFDALSELPANMWIGTSVENQEWADKRIPLLLQIPAKVRFLSVEPMLGPVDLKLPSNHIKWDYPTIEWVIYGGESGTKARPCNVEWIREGVKQCKAAGVACFVKQLGAHAIGKAIPSMAGSVERNLNADGWLEHSKGGDMAEWPEDLRVREFPIL